MKQPTYLLPAFLISFLFVVLLFFLGYIGALTFLSNGLQNTFFPLSMFVHQATISNTSQIDLLKKENQNLSNQLVALQELEADNKALRDQFQTAMPMPSTLLPSQVVSMNDTMLTIKGGSVDHVLVGDGVVVGSELIGQIAKTTDHFSIVTLVTNTSTTLAAKTSATAANGVIKGQGNSQMTLGSVVLSDTLRVNDFVVSLGNENVSGKGIPPGLVIGKIVSVNKNPSSLFQSAEVVPLLSFNHLSSVFVIIQ